MINGSIDISPTGKFVLYSPGGKKVGEGHLNLDRLPNLSNLQKSVGETRKAHVSGTLGVSRNGLALGFSVPFNIEVRGVKGPGPKRR